MRKPILAAIVLFASALGLMANDVEITGKYQAQIGCHGTYHEEISFVVEPGKDKFSGTKHAISLTADQKKQLRSGMKIKIKGKKQAATKKKMTKRAVREAMYSQIKDGAGMPLHSREMAEILGKIAVKPKSAVRSHDHGELQLEKVSDDAEVVEVTMLGHVVVETIEIVK